MKLRYSFLNNLAHEHPGEKADLTIWKNFKSGNEEAFILMYNTYANILYGFGCRFSPDQELVKDCLQDFFVYLREKRTGLGNPTSVKFYLLKAFKRRVISYIKKKQKNDEKSKKIAYEKFNIESSYDIIYIRQQEEGKFMNLERALKSLNSLEREAIYHFYYQSLSYQEIAEILGFSHVSSARRIIYRSLSKMRHCIKSTSR